MVLSEVAFIACNGFPLLLEIKSDDWEGRFHMYK